MNIPIFIFDDCGHRKYLFDVYVSDGELQSVQDWMPDLIERSNLHYSKYFAIYEGLEILVYEKGE